MSATLNAIDLFCGCGGWSKGLTDAGINVLAGIDIWPTAIESYKKNYHHKAICEDLTQYPPEQFAAEHNIQQIDILAGSPPCTGLSMAGRRDPKDPRNSLFMEFVKYLDYFAPKAFMMENVIGMLSMKTAAGEKIIDIIMTFFGKNYNCIITKLYASDFEVPQNRRRVIIIGIRKDLNIVPCEPTPVGPRPAVKTILLPREEVPPSYYLTEKALAGIAKKKERSAEKNSILQSHYSFLFRKTKRNKFAAPRTN